MSISTILKKLNSRDTKLFPRLPKLNKNIKFASILVAFVFLGLVAHQILADTTTINNNDAIKKYQDKQTAISAGNNQESWMSESIMSNAMSLNTAIAGTIPTNVLNGTSTTGWIPGGMVGFTNQSISYLYNPPASGVQYIAEVTNNFLGKPAYAATGYEGLQGILPIWKSFRNAIYVLFSIIFIGIGIAIMLRVKISQNAVITIQTAIPKLITSLILVTFSYAIAGLLIDASYLFSGIVLAILFNSKNGISGKLFAGTLNNPSFNDLVNGGFGVTYGLLYKILPMTLITVISAIISGIITGGIALLGGGITLVAGLVVGGISFILIILIILLTILIQTIKYFIGLAKCYISLILRIIFAPVEIGLGAIPNSKMNFSSWIWNIVANLAVFPCSTIFLVIINMILEAIDGGNLWSPPMMNLNHLLQAAIGIGSFFILAKLPKLIPEAVFNIKPSAFGKALGESFAPAGKMVSGSARYGAGRVGEFVGAKYGTDLDSGVAPTNAAERGANAFRNMTRYFTKK